MSQGVLYFYCNTPVARRTCLNCETTQASSSRHSCASSAFVHFLPERHRWAACLSSVVGAFCCPARSRRAQSVELASGTQASLTDCGGAQPAASASSANGPFCSDTSRRPDACREDARLRESSRNQRQPVSLPGRPTLRQGTK